MEYIKIFGITFNIDRVAFTIPIGGGFSIYWYGILIAIGCSLAMIYAYRRADEFGIDKDKGIDVVIIGLITAIIGARAYFLIFDGVPIQSFNDVIGIHNGGLAIYGGIIGGFAGAALMCKIRKVDFLAVADVGALGFLIGQAIGRWGNFINQEAYGKLTGSEWFGMTGSEISRVAGTKLVHPCFLYESLWCIIGFILLHKLSKKRKFNGQILLGYCVWYGAGRFFIESLRTDSLMIGNLRVSQLLSALLVVVSIVLYIILNNRKKALEASGYEGVFESMEDDDDLNEQVSEQETDSKMDVNEESSTGDVSEIDVSEVQEESSDEDDEIK